MSTQTLTESMELIAADCETDVRHFDGQPFTGKTVGTQFGNTLAMVAAIARAVTVLSERIDGLERTLASRTDHLV